MLVNSKHPNNYRILLFGGQYYVKLILTYYDNDTSIYDLKVVGGTYELKDKSIRFKNPPSFNDTVKTKYFIWPPRRLGPNYTFDLEEMVYTVFGFKKKVRGMLLVNWVIGTGHIREDETLQLDKEIFKITSK